MVTPGSPGGECPSALSAIRDPSPVSGQSPTGLAASRPTGWSSPWSPDRSSGMFPFQFAPASVDDTCQAALPYVQSE